MLSQGRSTRGIPRFPSVLEALASLPWYNREAASLTFNFRFDQGNLASTRHRQNSKLEAGKHTHIFIYIYIGQQDMHVCVCLCLHVCAFLYVYTCISKMYIVTDIYIYIHLYIPSLHQENGPILAVSAAFGMANLYLGEGLTGNQRRWIQRDCAIDHTLALIAVLLSFSDQAMAVAHHLTDFEDAERQALSEGGGMEWAEN